MDVGKWVSNSIGRDQEDLSVVRDSFRRPRFHAVWRPRYSEGMFQYEYTYRRSSYMHDFPTRKQRMALRRRIRLQQQNKQPPVPEPIMPSWVAAFAHPAISDCSCSAIAAAADSIHVQTANMVMSTINEETSVPKPPSRKNPIKKPKDLEDKVAALQLVVSRLHKMCLEKPEAVESTIPDETIQQFKEIRL